jgi:hypothetical protein
VGQGTEFPEGGLMQTWIEGETAPRQFILYADDDTPQNLVGSIVELLLTTSAGQALDTTGDLAVTVPGQGVVVYTPKPDAIQARYSPMAATFKVTDSLGHIGFYPGDGAEEWAVYPAQTAHPVYTFGDLRMQVHRWLDGVEDYNNGSTLDWMVRQQINESNTARSSEYPWPFMKADYDLPVTPDVLRYSMPGNLGRLLYLWSPNDQRYCQKIVDRHLDEAAVRFDGQQGSDYYQPFELRGTTLIFFQPPQHAESLKVGYFKTPQKLSNVSDIPSLPYPHSRLCVWDALLDLKSYATELGAAGLWERKQSEAEHKLYAAFCEGQTLQELPQTIRRGTGNF